VRRRPEPAFQPYLRKLTVGERHRGVPADTVPRSSGTVPISAMARRSAQWSGLGFSEEPTPPIPQESVRARKSLGDARKGRRCRQRGRFKPSDQNVAGSLANPGANISAFTGGGRDPDRAENGRPAKDFFEHLPRGLMKPCALVQSTRLFRHVYGGPASTGATQESV